MYSTRRMWRNKMRFCIHEYNKMTGQCILCGRIHKRHFAVARQKAKNAAQAEKALKDLMEQTKTSV